MDANVETIMPRTRSGTEGKQRMAFVRGEGDGETKRHRWEISGKGRKDDRKYKTTLRN